MPSGYINIDAETRRLIHNYNNKVYRQRKKGANIDYLRLSELAAMSPTQQRQTVRYAELYRQRGSEQISEQGIPYYRMQYAKELLNEVNKEREKRRKAIAPSKKKGNMFVVERANLKPRKLTFKNEQEFERLLKSLEQEVNPKYWQEGDKRYIENYLQGAERNLGAENAEKLREVLEQYKERDIFLTSAADTNLWIDEFYPVANEDVDSFTDSVVTKWSEALQHKRKKSRSKGVK